MPGWFISTMAFMTIFKKQTGFMSAVFPAPDQIFSPTFRFCLTQYLR